MFAVLSSPRDVGSCRLFLFADSSGARDDAFGFRCQQAEWLSGANHSSI